MTPAPDTTQLLPAWQWLQILGLGALMGAIGQVVRMLVGLKKLNEAASEVSKSAADCIQPSRMVVSLVIGSAAGALASVGLGYEMTQGNLFTMAAAGYSGADFIEGFVQRNSAVTGSGSAPVQETASPDGAVG